MICLCYNKEKGLFTRDEENVRSDETIIIKAHERDGFQTISGKEFELNSHTYDIDIKSNFNYGKASYLIAYIEIDHRTVLNFNCGDYKEMWGMSRGSLRGFYEDPAASNKWENLFRLIIDVCEKNNRYYGSFVKYYKFLKNSIKDAEQDFIENKWAVRETVKRISEDINEFLYCTNFIEIYKLYKGTVSENTILSFPSLFVEFFRDTDSAFTKYSIDGTLPEFKIIRLAVKRLLEGWIVPQPYIHFIKKSDVDFLNHRFSWRVLDDEKTNIHSLDDRYYVCTTSIREENKWELVDNKDNVVCSLPNGYEESRMILPSKDTSPILVVFVTPNGKTVVYSFLDGVFTYKFSDNEYFQNISGFNHGLAMIKNKGKFGVINEIGKIVIEPEYDYIEDFYSYFQKRVKAQKEKIVSEINLSELIPGQPEKSIVGNTNVLTQPTVPTVEDTNTTGREDSIFNDATTTTIKQIGCEDFKRFRQLKPLSISTINFIVGENNAGKSTFIEIVKICMDRLFQLVNLKGNPTEELFNIDYDHYVTHSRGKEDKDIVLTISFSNNITACYTLAKREGKVHKQLDINYVRSLSENSGFGIRYALAEDGKMELEVTDDKEEHLELFESGVKNKGEKTLNILQNQSILNATEERLKNFFSGREEEITVFTRSLKSACTAAFDVNHIPAWLYDNVIEDFIKEYCSSDNEAKKISDDFINKWIDKFDIGSDFGFDNALNKESDFPKLFIKDEEGIEEIGAKGTGSRHFTYLLLEVCRTLLMALKTPHVLPIVLIEEPEQNLHPKLQSLIADFLWDITRYWKKMLKRNDASLKISGLELHIIVETHSEYLIRRSQRFVKTFCSTFEIEDNPFRTFYFPKEKDPYDMEYTETGRFNHEFGTGFYDEAARLSFQISSL